MKTRQEKWKEKGYTQEQIESHLQWERAKSKQARERRKKNNEKNKELINTIKKDLKGITFSFANKTITIHDIRPTVDGEGFFFTYTGQYSDGSYGKFKGFSRFDDYKYVDFIDYLKY
jgi:DNA-binding transcriptional MerR regulator